MTLSPDALRSRPDDATIREGLRRAYRPYTYVVLGLFMVVVPPLTALRAAFDGQWVVRTLLSLLVLGVTIWSTGRALRYLVQAGLAERTGKEAVIQIPSTPHTFIETERSVVFRGRGLGTVVLAKRDVPAAVLARLRVV